MFILVLDLGGHGIESRLTETDDLIALFDEVLHCNSVLVCAIGE